MFHLLNLVHVVIHAVKLQLHIFKLGNPSPQLQRAYSIGYVRRYWQKILSILLLVLIHLPTTLTGQINTAKPWAYWWWMGSAVNKSDIRKNLEDFAHAGFGGMHIIPIYGVKGEEAHFLQYFSPQWLEMLDYTCNEAKKLHLGIDLTLGTGWPYGGSQVKAADAAQAFHIQLIQVSATKKITELPILPEKWKGAHLIALSAFSEQGFLQKIDLEKGISWQYPQDSKLYALYQIPTEQKVKRAAPGGEGLVLDHFNAAAIQSYLQFFGHAFTQKNYAVRAFYNDSYEVYGANWTGSFLTRFQQLRGYDLAKHLNVLARDTAISDSEKRIWADYHETLSDILLEDFTQPLTHFTHQYNKILRDEAHGAPANLLDLYAATDVPETEFFGSKPYKIPGYRVDPDYEVKRFGQPDAFVLKWASSAAHVAGKKLVSCETATWLGNHFKVSLAMVKPIIDECLVSGVSHIFYHGVPYSPPGAEFPGWLFYASTNFNQQSHFWPFLPFLNTYIERCQSRLQAAKPDSDVLLYFPVYDIWHAAGRKSKTHPLEVHSMVHEIKETPFGKMATFLNDQGYAFDFISDRQIQDLQVKNGAIISSGGARYKSLIIPACEHMPIATLEALLRLKQSGVAIVFDTQLPSTVNGWNDLAKRQQQFQKLLVNFKAALPQDWQALLQKNGVRREKMAEQGLHFIRKKTSKGTLYFISNLAGRFVQDKITLAVNAKTLQFYDPLHNREGMQSFKVIAPQLLEVNLNLAPGESIFIAALDKNETLPTWSQPFLTAHSIELQGSWHIEFIEGKPFLPQPYHTPVLQSWTSAPDSNAQFFSGTARYNLQFSLPKELVGQKALLDLGDLREMAKVYLNGQDLGAVWCLPFILDVPEHILQEKNELSIEATNLSANRVRYLDQQKTPWKKFYDINMVDIRYQPFDASKWDLVPSGLLGPVKLNLPQK